MPVYDNQEGLNMTFNETLLTGVFAVASTTLPAVIVYVRAKSSAENERLRKKLVTALSDLRFYQALENEFNAEWTAVANEHGKPIFRKTVTLNHGLTLSGKLPPSRVAQYLSEFAEKK